MLTLPAASLTVFAVALRCEVIAKRGPGDLAQLLRAGDTWKVK